MCSSLGPEPVRNRQEVGLEDRFQHQLQRGLDHQVRDHGDGDFILSSSPWSFRIMVCAAAVIEDVWWRRQLLVISGCGG
jgi:hypothetical protein